MKQRLRASRRRFRLSLTFAAVALLPLSFSAAEALWMTAAPVLSLNPTWTALFAGAAAYAAFHFFVHKPIGLYVFGHEVTHAIAAFLCGCRVRSLTASPKGGHVMLSDTNAFIALAPYCVPLFALCLSGVYLVVHHYARFAAAPVWYAAALGAAMAFHVALTAYALWNDQPDLDVAGPFFSLPAILLANTLVAALLLKTLFPASVSLAGYGAAVWRSLSGLASSAATLASKAASL